MQREVWIIDGFVIISYSLETTLSLPWGIARTTLEFSHHGPKIESRYQTPGVLHQHRHQAPPPHPPLQPAQLPTPPTPWASEASEAWDSATVNNMLANCFISCFDCFCIMIPWPMKCLLLADRCHRESHIRTPQT